MHGIYELKEQLIEELEQFGTRGSINRSDLPTIDTLAHAAKNVCKIIEACEDMTGYSYGSRSMRVPNMRGYSYSGARRDSMGRYSGNNMRGYSEDNEELLENLYVLRDHAGNDHMRAEFDEFISRMERMK